MKTLEAKWMKENSLPEFFNYKIEKTLVIPKNSNYFDDFPRDECIIIHDMIITKLSYWSLKPIIED